MDKTLYPWPAVLVVSSEYCILDTRVTVDVNQLLFNMILCHFFKIRPRVKFQVFLLVFCRFTLYANGASYLLYYIVFYICYTCI